MPRPAERGDGVGGAGGAGGAVVQRSVERIDARGAQRRERDSIARETPIALVYNGQPHAVMMASPRDLEDFALGFSYTEEIIEAVSDLRGSRVVPLERGVRVDMMIPKVAGERLAQRGRGLAGRSGCGLCGVREIEQAVRPVRHVAAGSHYELAALQRALTDLRSHQAINHSTGAVHAAAWAAPDGGIVCVREDVGRHNALDKLAGALLRGEETVPRGFLVMSSRASFEIVQKAARLGADLVVAISGPTSLAIELAEEAGMTLVAFARENGCVVYSAPARLRGTRRVAA